MHLHMFRSLSMHQRRLHNAHLPESCLLYTSLAELEQAGKLKAVITQNIDKLHQMAGSKKVLELHGSVYRNYCMKCHRFYDFAHMKASTGVPRCECGGKMCIRDRCRNGRSWEEIFLMHLEIRWSFICRKGQWEKNRWNTPIRDGDMAVSYTHLDVYKRQLQA